MPLFEKDETPELKAAERIVVMREKGTRRLLFLTIGVILLWYVWGQAEDYRLHRQVWKPLAPDAAGLTVVGTLDSRGDYDRNMFKIIQANKTTTVELTNAGWNYCFPGEGKLFQQEVGDIIRGVIQVDGKLGYAILTQYVKAGISRFRQEPNAAATIREDLPISIPGQAGKTETLGALLAKYRDSQKVKEATSDESGGGSASGRTAEHGMFLPGEVVLNAAPVVLNASNFTSAEVTEQPSSVLTDKMFTVRLNLTPEGRSRFYQWSKAHENESLVFIVNGDVKTAGRITQALDVNWWEINNIRDEDGAKALADSVNKAIKQGK